MRTNFFKLGLVTCEEIPELIPTEQALLPLLEERNIQGIPLIWSDPKVDWATYDALLVRSIWDYHLHFSAFQEWLNHIESLSLKVWNPIPILRENSHKFYLQKLENQGVPIIPSLFLPQGESINLKDIFQKTNWSKLVVKPAVSAGAYLTYVLHPHQLEEGQSKLQKVLKMGDVIVQEFAEEIAQTGELSFMFFEGEYSHSVVKLPQKNDFRVQVEHGGRTLAYQASSSLIGQVQKIINLYPNKSLYARVDGIIREGIFYLMELELIEPELFFDIHPSALARFAQAIESKYI